MDCMLEGLVFLVWNRSFTWYVPEIDKGAAKEVNLLPVCVSVCLYCEAIFQSVSNLSAMVY